MIIIVVNSLCGTSETFIRDHVRLLAPWQTAVISDAYVDAAQLDYPVVSLNPRSKGERSLLKHITDSARYRLFRYLRPRLSRRQEQRVREAIATYKPAALLAEFGPNGCYFADLCAEASVPLYVHFHGFDASILLRKRHWVRHYRALFAKAAGVIAPSRFLAGKLAEIGCPADLLHVSPCGVDPAKFPPTERLPGRILAVGRLVEKKAPNLTIEAFARLSQWHPEVRLDLVGGGPLANSCRAQIAGLGLEDRVHMHGEQSWEAVRALMRQASIFVQHSVTARNGDTEGLPVAILEAMASALPVVSTRHSGIPEAVMHAHTGFLVGEGDVDAMAASLDTLIRDPERAAIMGAAGRERVIEQFTQKQSIERLQKIMGLPSDARAAAPLSLA